ncbi:hypothetical protein [Actinocrispum wychmicini]|uniref:Uncharacterized protein n=1 Tax=Actinocrispum wychmicini TaxID=1213861 RepID=A0A4R2J529_9PSEU|nr:hypothetical protein [Actinocrispum wychmicini]TCO52422.1 hypothetical protein EV192_112154 [Actinocrispum wychmicini]
MALNSSGVSVESWVELGQDVTMRQETDLLNQQAMLYFGNADEYVLILGRENLRQVISLATKALSELDAKPE